MFDWEYRFVRARLHAYINGELPPVLRRYIARQLASDNRCYAEYRRQLSLRDEFEYQFSRVGRTPATQLQNIWGKIEQDLSTSQQHHTPVISKYHRVLKTIFAYSTLVAVVVFFILLPLNLYSLDGNIAVPAQPSPESVLHTPTPSANNRTTNFIAYVAETERAYEIVEWNRQFLANTPAPLSPRS